MGDYNALCSLTASYTYNLSNQSTYLKCQNQSGAGTGNNSDDNHQFVACFISVRIYPRRERGQHRIERADCSERKANQCASVGLS